ncbi:MAG: triose-phosphate isomerase [Sulfuritalea sp.]|nr:triose-phosphate isomerase [Sulfuritalea sp.]
MRTKLVAGNWKMNGRLHDNAALLTSLQLTATKLKWGCQVTVCVPCPYLTQARAILSGSPVMWGGQDVSEHGDGAYTGEVSAGMLTDLHCTHVLVGHSERRALFGESDQGVAAKFAAALGAGLVPILCVGETLAEREAGITGEVVTRQLDAVLARSGVAALAKAVVAYEPVWAIGTGKTASPQQAQEVHALIRARVARDDAAVAGGLRILYGGSVKAANAAELFAMPDIDGGLIGGASLVAAEFIAICAAAA